MPIQDVYYLGYPKKRGLSHERKIVVTLVPSHIFLYDEDWIQIAITRVERQTGMATQALTQNNHGHHLFCHALVRVVCVALVLTNAVWLGIPISTWATVYKCVDQAGRSVLTNRKAGLQSCRVILEDATGEPKSGVGKKPKHVNPPTDEGMMPSFTDTPPPPMVFPNDPPVPSMNMPPSETSSTQPCAPGFNPLNPMSTAPCAQ